MSNQLMGFSVTRKKSDDPADPFRSGEATCARCESAIIPGEHVHHAHFIRARWDGEDGDPGYRGEAMSVLFCNDCFRVCYHILVNKVPPSDPRAKRKGKRRR